MSLMQASRTKKFATAGIGVSELSPHYPDSRRCPDAKQSVAFLLFLI